MAGVTADDATVETFETLQCQDADALMASGIRNITERAKRGPFQSALSLATGSSALKLAAEGFEVGGSYVVRR